jgi:hypothetical protein
MIALRVTSQRDRGAVASTIPDDLGDLSELLPALRTGEALVLGDALQVPSRIRVNKAVRKPVGGIFHRLPRGFRDTGPTPSSTARLSRTGAVNQLQLR